MKKWLFLLAIFVGAAFQGNATQEVSARGFLGPMEIANLNFNRQGNVIVARPGEKIFSTINFSCNPTFIDSDTLYQIVIGYEHEGPQKCIFNELGYRCKEGILSFFCEAPAVPGVYEVQCDFTQARSSVEAMQSWWREQGLDAEFDAKITVGRIIVR